MVAQLLKRIAAQLPESLQHELRRLFFSLQISRRQFATDEKEYALLHTFIQAGDWVLDIGANVGHYTRKMSELVGPTGRVIAFEPVPDTFALLAANTRLFPYANVSLLNIAASDRAAAVGIQIPRFFEGLQNYYQAHLSSEAKGLTTITIPVDAIPLPAIVRLVKIDVEGHELAVLHGMRKLLERDRPILIVETSAQETVDLLHESDYATERLPGSSNLVCRPAVQAR
jgi:FkbM family methyltransferase